MVNPKVKSLRSNQTEAENRLWRELRAKRFQGAKIRRQVPIGPFVVDFVCHKNRLVIEIDGGQHGEQGDYDQKRTEYLNAEGFRVIRFWNNEVLENLNGVLEIISRHLK